MISRAIKDAHPDCEVVEAHDGFRAGTIVVTLRPDVVVLDLRMPGIDGYEVCRLIKSQAATRHTEVVVVTAYPSPEGEKRILGCGARVCLAKPLDMENLLKEIDAALADASSGARVAET
jgi:two-component system cell cycle response regulator